MSLSLAEKLGLWKALTEELAAFREKELLPQATKEMPPGARLPVMFGGEHAGWANMPQGSRKAAYVKDEDALLAWVRANYPDRVEYVPEVIVDAGLLEFLQEHRPESLSVRERPDPQWIADIAKALTGGGHYVTITGEKLTEVPGIKVPEAEVPVPHVNLNKHAQGIIRRARAAGQIELGEMLSLPAGETSQEAPHAA